MTLSVWSIVEKPDPKEYNNNLGHHKFLHMEVRPNERHEKKKKLQSIKPNKHTHNILFSEGIFMNGQPRLMQRESFPLTTAENRLQLFHDTLHYIHIQHIWQVGLNAEINPFQCEMENDGHSWTQDNNPVKK